jgi:hypothetical protein
MPPELLYIWEHFIKLIRRRQSGMAANPLTDEALEAYERRALVGFSAWEKDLIFRVDDAVLAVWAEQTKTGAPAEVEAPIDDPGAVRGLLSGIRERMAAGSPAKPE